MASFLNKCQEVILYVYKTWGTSSASHFGHTKSAKFPAIEESHLRHCDKIQSPHNKLLTSNNKATSLEALEIG
jgi:hypothetical protein